MSKIIVFCGDCDKWCKEKDCVDTKDEGHICFTCLKIRNEHNGSGLKQKGDLSKWLKN